MVNKPRNHAPQSEEYLNHIALKISPPNFKALVHRICAGRWWSFNQIKREERPVPTGTCYVAMPWNKVMDVILFDAPDDMELLREIEIAYRSL